MSTGRSALAFAAGFGKGYLSKRDKDKQEALEAEDRAIRMEDVEYKRGQRQQEKDLQIGLKDAARPATMEEGAGGVLLPASADNRDVGQPDGPTPGDMQPGFRVQGQSFGDRQSAQAAQAKANTPDAVTLRQAQVYRNAGKPDEAAKLENTAMDMADKRWGRQIREATARGHAGLAELVTRSEAGPLAGMKVQPVPTPDGKMVEYHKVNPDGTTAPTGLKFPNNEEGVIRAAYQLDRSITPEARYKHMVAEDKQTAAQAAKEKELELRKRQLEEVSIPTAESRAALAETRAQLAQMREMRLAAGGGKGGGADKVGKEERLRYTSLFSEAGRRMGEAQKVIGALQKDPVFMTQARKPGSPQAEELAAAKQALAGYSEERTLYQSLLAGSQTEGKLSDVEPKAGSGGKGGGGGKPPAAAAAAPAGPAKDARPTSKAEYEALPKGSRYWHPKKQQWMVKG